MPDTTPSILKVPRDLRVSTRFSSSELLVNTVTVHGGIPVPISPQLYWEIEDVVRSFTYDYSSFTNNDWHKLPFMKDVLSAIEENPYKNMQIKKETAKKTHDDAQDAEIDTLEKQNKFLKKENREIKLEIADIRERLDLLEIKIANGTKGSRQPADADKLTRKRSREPADRPDVKPNIKRSK